MRGIALSIAVAALKLWAYVALIGVITLIGYGTVGMLRAVGTNDRWIGIVGVVLLAAIVMLAITGKTCFGKGLSLMMEAIMFPFGDPDDLLDR